MSLCDTLLPSNRQEALYADKFILKYKFKCSFLVIAVEWSPHFEAGPPPGTLNNSKATRAGKDFFSPVEVLQNVLNSDNFQHYHSCWLMFH